METLENERLSKDAENAILSIENIFRASPIGIGESHDTKVTLSAYILYAIKAAYGEAPNPDLQPEDAMRSISTHYFDEAVKWLFQGVTDRHILSNVWRPLLDLARGYSLTTFQEIVTTNREPAGSGRDEPFMTNPESINKLVVKILSIKDTDTVGDLWCRNGSFLMTAKEACPGAKYSGFERYEPGLLLAEIRTTVLMDPKDKDLLKATYTKTAESNISALSNSWEKGTVKVYQKPIGFMPRQQFDKVFSLFPWGLRKIEDVELFRGRLPFKISTSRPDWLWVLQAVQAMKPGGKAVAILANGATFTAFEREARKYFIDHGLVEALITLPNGIFYGTKIGTTMIVLSQGNKKVRMIDASGKYEKGRRTRYLTDEMIQEILNEYHSEDKMAHAGTFTNEEIAERDYNFSPSSYVMETIPVKYGRRFEDIMTDFTRGAPITAKQLDALNSMEPTEYEYLMLSDIQNGMVSPRLKFLKEIPDKLKKYLIPNHSLVISKIGAPYKVTVVEVPEGKKILATGNMYVVTLDESKADPWFMQAFLESNMGKALLGGLSAGSIIQSIGVDILKNMEVSVPPLEEQYKIAAAYRNAQKKVVEAQENLTKALQELHEVMDKGGTPIADGR